MHKIHFTKMHGAGNDFVMVDDREGVFPAAHPLIAAFAAPRTGIGCEGVILIRKSEIADFKMTFFNPDGTEADLCGNGSRCAASFGVAIGAAHGPALTMETRAGLLDAEILEGGLVRIWMPEPRDRKYGLTVETSEGPVKGDLVTVGVPHFIVSSGNPATMDVVTIGRAVRLSSTFAPDGTNVDFVHYGAGGRVVMRTYERGVEAESGACGTGAVATAVVGVETKGMSLPMRIRASAGFELMVEGDWRRAKGTGFTLTGPVATVFEGEMDLDAIDVEM